MPQFTVRLENSLSEEQAETVSAVVAPKLGQEPRQLARRLLAKGTKPLIAPTTHSKATHIAHAFQASGTPARVVASRRRKLPAFAAMALGGLLIVGSAALAIWLSADLRLAGASSLSIETTFREGDTFVVEGSTDLPRGAGLLVTLDRVHQPQDEAWVGEQARTAVSGGAFRASLEIPRHPDFQRGPYNVRVRFHPRDQPRNVARVVGSKGAGLRGPLAQSCSSWTCLVSETRHERDLPTDLPNYIVQPISRFSRGTPEFALANFVHAWKDQDFARMATFTQWSWRIQNAPASEYLANNYDFKEVVGFEVLRTERADTTIGASSMRDVTFRVAYRPFGQEPVEDLVRARVILERGEWGVNPYSTLSGERVN